MSHRISMLPTPLDREIAAVRARQQVRMQRIVSRLHARAVPLTTAAPLLAMRVWGCPPELLAERMADRLAPRA